MIRITDEDVEFAEELLLPEGKKFDEERRRVIKCLDSIDVHACPGSGKTTALLAKLVILAQKMPFRGNRGVCVLTHTNVAIDEVERRVGVQAYNLLRYPNFFGTIQAFVDKYLAIPAYIEFFGKRPHRIDNDVYFDIVERTYKSMGWGTRSFIERKREPLSWLKNIRFDLEKGYLVNGLMGDKEFANDECSSAKEIFNFKLDIMKKGYLCFDDAYFLAYQYVNKHADQIRSILSERFAYVFIDEMQDTDIHQLNILDKVFDSSKNIVIQRIGDPNQAIYSDTSSREDQLWDIRDGSLCIMGSKRFPPSIAEVVSNLCCTPQNIIGNREIEDIPPTIIAFDDNNASKVLECFGDQICKYNLHLKDRPIFKAVGWISKEHDKRTLLSYWDGYKRTTKKKKTEFQCFQDYLQRGNDKTIQKLGSNYYRKNIINMFVKILRLLNIKESEHNYYSEATLLKALNKANKECHKKLQLKLALWCISIHNGTDISSDVIDFINTDFKNAFGIQSYDSIKDFFIPSDASVSCETNTESESDKAGLYRYSKDGKNISIEVATVHSVKGETHTATLYVETFYKKYDIERLIDYLVKKETDKSKKKKMGKEELKALKIAYVGMSRPSNLLCVAAHKDSIETHEEAFVKAGWEVVKLCN